MRITNKIGDTTLLSELYDMTKGWVDLLISYSDSHNGSMGKGPFFNFFPFPSYLIVG